MEETLRRIALLALIVLLNAATYVSIPAQASSRGELTVSPSLGKVSQSYPRIPGAKPQAPRTLFAQIRPPGCADGGPNSAYCDTIVFNIDQGQYDELYYVEVTLSYNPDTGPQRNRVDLYVWADDDPALGGPTSDDTGAQQPKVARVGEPPTGMYWITVVNIEGVNEGYTITAEFKKTDLGPDFRRRASPSPTPSPSATKRAAAPPPPKSPEEVLIVRTVGPDGQPTEFAIPIVKFKGAGARAEEDGGNPLLAMVLSLLGVGLITFLYLAVWRRRRRAA